MSAPTSEALPRSDCLRLLASRSWGRVAFTQRALPAIQPLAYTLVGDYLVLHAGTDGLERTLDGQIIAFQADDLDPVTGTGWTVVVTGPAHLWTWPSDLARPARAAAARRRSTQVTLSPGAISGRRTASPGREAGPARSVRSPHRRLG